MTSTSATTRRPAHSRIFYRKEKLQGACWEYEIAGGWLEVDDGSDTRRILRHTFRFYRPRQATRRTRQGAEVVQRAAAEQWFFPDRWFSLLRFTTEDDQTIGYYVNFSRPLSEIRRDYYADIDLELDLWVDLDGTVTELDRDEFEREIAGNRLPPDWAEAVVEAASNVTSAVTESIAENGPDVESTRDPVHGIPEFILKA
jgi:predicted RNA-binding protein associated with RNAse of E/G family